jgi:hypothetical protein
VIAMDSAAIYYATWLLAVVSLVGTYLNIKKQKACFVIWRFTNALRVLYDFSIGAYAQAALMLCYFVLAVHGFYEWRKGTTIGYIKIYESGNVTSECVKSRKKIMFVWKISPIKPLNLKISFLFCKIMNYYHTF